MISFGDKVKLPVSGAAKGRQVMERMVYQSRDPVSIISIPIHGKKLGDAALTKL
jgi:hypothetical protein